VSIDVNSTRMFFCLQLCAQMIQAVAEELKTAQAPADVLNIQKTEGEQRPGVKTGISLRKLCKIVTSRRSPAARAAPIHALCTQQGGVISITSQPRCASALSQSQTRSARHCPPLMWDQIDQDAPNCLAPGPASDSAFGQPSLKRPQPRI